MASSATSATQRLAVPTYGKGKRSRSNSVSSSTSSTGSSADGRSIFSQFNSSQSVDSLSSCSSPASEKASPTASSVASEEERPCKALRTERVATAPVSVAPPSRPVNEEDATLATLEEKCSLNADNVAHALCATESARVETVSSASLSATPAAGKSMFVDCLVDATVHVLDMLWHAPIHKSIAFLDNVRNVPKISQSEFVRPCKCPVGAPLTGGIPLDLFIRETLRRSRTSCSTLQAALLYCKRVGFEVVRKRAEMEGVQLSVDELQVLEGGSRAYPSLPRSIDASTMTGSPQGTSIDPLLCSRRTFLASIMVSSKFLQDRTFSNRAWSKISGLNVKELGFVERRMLDAIEFDLSVNDGKWQAWTHYLKGEWKANLANCHCKLSSVEVEASSAAASNPRKALERTTSLRIGDMVDMTLPQPNLPTEGDSPSSSPCGELCDSGASTPTQRSQPTTTLASGHRRETSLLATAVNNSIFGVMHNSPAHSGIEVTSLTGGDAILASTSTLPLPFPMRKGLVVRSISAR